MMNLRDFLIALKIERYRTILKRKMIAWITAPFIFLFLLTSVPFILLLHLAKALFEFFIEAKEAFGEVFFGQTFSFDDPFKCWNNLKRGLPANSKSIAYGTVEGEEFMEANKKMREEFQRLKNKE